MVICPLIAGWYESGNGLEISQFYIEFKVPLRIVECNCTKRSLGNLFSLAIRDRRNIISI